MDNNKSKRQEYYEFFKDVFDVDLSNMTKEEQEAVLNKINSILDSKINEEEEKKEDLMREYYNGDNKISILKDDLYNELIR